MPVWDSCFSGLNTDCCITENPSTELNWIHCSYCYQHCFYALVSEHMLLRVSQQSHLLYSSHWESLVYHSLHNKDWGLMQLPLPLLSPFYFHCVYFSNTHTIITFKCWSGVFNFLSYSKFWKLRSVNSGKSATLWQPP